MSQRFLRFSSLLLLVSILLLSTEAFAQKITWRYVRTIYGGVKIYLNDEVTTLPNKHLVVWDMRWSNKLKIRYFRTTPQQADGVFARKFLPKAAKPRIF